MLREQRVWGQARAHARVPKQKFEIVVAFDHVRQILEKLDEMLARDERTAHIIATTQ